MYEIKEVQAVYVHKLQRVKKKNEFIMYVRTWKALH